MHRTVIFVFGLLVYILVATIALQSFGVGLIASAILIFGLPAYLLAHYSAAPQTVVVTVASFAAGVTLLLETTGHYYGLWTVSGIEELQLFGIPTEMLGVTLLKVLFLVLLYELIFDDGEYSQSNARTRLGGFILFGFGTLTLLAFHYFVFGSMFVSSGYYWIALILIMASFAMVAVSRKLTVNIFDQVAYFALVAFIPLLCFEYIAVASGVKVVAASASSIIPVFAVGLPLGEIVLALTLPVFVATTYELYLDDGV